MKLAIVWAISVFAATLAAPMPSLISRCGIIIVSDIIAYVICAEVILLIVIWRLFKEYEIKRMKIYFEKHT